MPHRDTLTAAERNAAINAGLKTLIDAPRIETYDGLERKDRLNKWLIDDGRVGIMFHSDHGAEIDATTIHLFSALCRTLEGDRFPAGMSFPVDEGMAYSGLKIPTLDTVKTFLENTKVDSYQKLVKSAERAVG